MNILHDVEHDGEVRMDGILQLMKESKTTMMKKTATAAAAARVNAKHETGNNTADVVIADDDDDDANRFQEKRTLFTAFEVESFIGRLLDEGTIMKCDGFVYSCV